VLEGVTFITIDNMQCRNWKHEPWEDW